jgi:uncharacterized protein with GYD domain
VETYVFLLRADRGAALSVLASGTDGANQQSDAIETLGGKLERQWAVAGRYDVVLVASFPDVEAMLAFSLLQSGAGLYCEPLRAMEPTAVDGARSRTESLLKSSRRESHLPKAGRDRRPERLGSEQPCCRPRAPAYSL